GGRASPVSGPAAGRDRKGPDDDEHGSGRFTPASESHATVENGGLSTTSAPRHNRMAEQGPQAATRSGDRAGTTPHAAVAAPPVAIFRPDRAIRNLFLLQPTARILFERHRRAAAGIQSGRRSPRHQRRRAPSQGELRRMTGEAAFLRPELGTKRTCQHCGARFYDLGRDPIVCPKCGHEHTAEMFNRMRRARPAAEAAAIRPPKPDEVDVVIDDAEDLDVDADEVVE